MINSSTIQIPDDMQLSGFVLFGTSQMLVGLRNSQWLRIPLSAYPALQGLAEEDLLEYRLADGRTALKWPGYDISLSLRNLAANAIALDGGDKGPA